MAGGYSNAGCGLWAMGTIAFISACGWAASSGTEPERLWRASFIVFFIIFLFLVFFQILNVRDKNKQGQQQKHYDLPASEPSHVREIGKKEQPVNDASHDDGRWTSISRSYFDGAQKMAERLYRYQLAREADKGFTDFVADIGGLQEVDTLDWGHGRNPRVSFFLLYELTHDLQHMGHSVRPDSREILPLYLYLNRLLCPSTHLTYDQLDTIYHQLSPSMSSMLQTVAEATCTGQGEGPYGSLMRTVLTEYDPTKIKEYDDLLFDVFTFISMADGTVSDKERKWLEGLSSANKEVSKGTEGSKAEAQKGEKPPLEQLNDLIGLDTVKEEVQRLSNFIRIQRMRKERGLKASPISYHCVFTGNPGTGKTTVARIIAGIYRDLGILTKGHLVETDRAGLVAEYVGQTAVKTNKIIDSALDGVLFIDEAYSLVQGGNSDYGSEAIATLLKRMEDDRDRLVVILAGYGDEMRGFIDSNPGLQSRFNRYIHFPDYDAASLADIYLGRARSHDYRLTPEAEDKLHRILRDAVEHKDRNFGNARYVRNLFEKTLEAQATRLSASSTAPDDDALQTILPQDLP